MERIRNFVASALMALIVLAGFGFGILAVGFAIVLGAGFALALRLAGPRLAAQAERRAAPAQSETPEPGAAEPAAG